MKIDETNIHKYEKFIKRHKDYNAFEKERIHLCHKYAAKDKNDRFIIQNQSYKIIGNIEFFKKEYDELKIKYKDYIDFNSIPLETRVLNEMRKVKLNRILK